MTELALKPVKSAPLRTDYRFRATKTGSIGLQRESMLKNELHLLPELGKSRRRGHKLPGPNFIYGNSYEKLDGGVAEALQHWVNLAKDSKAREERYKLVRDFIALNKEAVRAGCVTAKQNDHFRSLNDIRRKVYMDNGSALALSSSDGMSRTRMHFPADMTFGMPHRPSTPINEVIEHKYMRDWLAQMEQAEAEKMAAKKEASKAIAGAYHTKSSWLKNAKIPVEEKPLWKMARFRNIDAAVDSFRTDVDRQKAYSANVLLDKVARQGTNSFNQGVYNVTKTSLPS